jgi:hypothetical protein
MRAYEHGDRVETTSGQRGMIVRPYDHSCPGWWIVRMDRPEYWGEVEMDCVCHEDDLRSEIAAS